jgi:hypothetical protein
MTLLCSQLAFSMEPSVTILGDVVGKGSTEMKTAFDKWISVSDKAYPLIDGAHLRSGDGMMSSIFRDGARMEVGKNAEITVSGSRGNYTIDLGKGKIAFSLPQGIFFSVTTPTATIQTQVQPNMIQRVSTSQDYVRGSVGYDGKGTTVTAVSGTLMVKDAKGTAAHTVTAGNSIYIAGAESGRRATPAQLAEVVKNDTGTNQKTPSDDEDRRRVVPFFWLGGAVLLEGGTYLYVNSQYKTKGFASPSRP